MKQELLNSLRLRVCLLVAVMAFAVNGAWADSKTFTFTQNTDAYGSGVKPANNTDLEVNTTFTIAPVSVKYTVKGGTTDLRWWNTTDGLRAYKDNQWAIEVADGYEIEKVEYTGTIQIAETTSTQGSIKNNTWMKPTQGGITSVSFKGTHTSSNRTIQSITVTYSSTVVDNRTPVNITGFTAELTTLTKGNTTTTIVTNDQTGWTSDYTYSSSNNAVATVDNNGVITAVAKGTAIITAELNVAEDDANYKAGTITSKSIDIIVNNPSHTATFSVNGNSYGNAVTVEEGDNITFPSNPDDINGMTFVGWKNSTITGTTEDGSGIVSSAVMGSDDVTYYAVFAEMVESYSDTEMEMSQTLQYDTWTYSGSTTNKSSNSYRLFHKDSYIESTAFDLSLLKKVIVYGGTYGGDSYNSLTIGDGTSTWKSVTVSGSSQTGANTYTNGNALSGTNKLRITCNSGTASSSGVRISKVEIYTKKKTSTYAHYCTTVSALPRPVITMADVEMTWGDADKSVAPTATVGEAAYDGAYVYTVDKDGLTVAADGKLSSSTPGTYVVTATIEASETHQAAQTTCTVTVGKQNITLAFAETTVNKMTRDASYTQTATATPAAYDGTITYAITSSTSEDAMIDNTSAQLLFDKTGTIVVTATAPATAKYNGNTCSYTLNIKTTPTIIVEDMNIAYGETYNVDSELIEGGIITVTSSNPSVATVSGLAITSVAAGTATITVATAANDTYVAGAETFKLIVTAPEGSGAKPSADPVSVFYESFNNSEKTGGNDNTWSGISGVQIDPQTDNNGWSFVKGYAASKCSRYGTGNDQGSAKTPVLNLEEGITYTLTFKAGAWNGSSEKTALTISATNATLDKSSVTMKKGEWTSYEVTITNASANTTITFSGSDGYGRFFLDEVRITKPGTPIASTSVTTTGNLATYCYEYPLNIDGISGAKAYKVTSVDTEQESVKMEQITGTIKGGVPFILKSDAEAATIEIPLADESTTIPTSNALVGTLAPTFVAQVYGDYTNFAYSKSNKCFVMLGDNGNTVPANRAYLPINLNNASGIKSFALSFDDADGITSTMDATRGNEQIYNLAGQRISKPVRGINIINGKKVFVK